MGLGIKFPQNFIVGGKGPYEEWSAPMVDLINYDFTSIIYKTVKPEELFINL